MQLLSNIMEEKWGKDWRAEGTGKTAYVVNGFTSLGQMFTPSSSSETTC